jgi:SAM-dependent methyltransferase
MKMNRDAYGEQILAQFKAKNHIGLEIVERDDGFIQVGDYCVRYFTDFSRWDKSEQAAIKLAKGKVLDVGCGAGRHCLYLQRKGFDVVGIDNSPGAIAVCKARGVKKAELISISDIRRLKEGSFDSIIMMGNNFGLFGSPKGLKTILKQLSKITSDHAQIIAENRNPYVTDNPVHLGYHKFNKKRGRMPGQLRIRVRFNKTMGEWFDYLFVSPQELKKLLEGTDWKVKKIFNEKDPTYIAVLEKAK